MTKNYRQCFLFLACLLLSLPALACTDFRLKAQDGTLLITRSMEFAVPMNANLMSSPRGRMFTSVLPGMPVTGKPMTWKSKYGYLFLDAFNTGVALDGLNEAGLAIEALYLPGETQYQTVPAGREAQGLVYLLFGDWVLGNFQSVAEVKAALANVIVYAQPLPQFKNMIFPLHFNITDNTGQSIVVEFTGGQMHVYDNQIGVLTNSPTYDWHISNLRNYVNLSPVTPQPVVDGNITFAATGQGAGMVGLPGDISPPSRFVKMSIMLKTVLAPATADSAVNLAEHIINNVDIPLGFVREAQTGKNTNELTQWVVIKDLTHKMFYYRTYGDLTLRGVDMAKVNFAPGTPQLKMAIEAPQHVVDMTQTFMGKQ